MEEDSRGGRWAVSGRWAMSGEAADGDFEERRFAVSALQRRGGSEYAVGRIDFVWRPLLPSVKFRFEKEFVSTPYETAPASTEVQAVVEIPSGGEIEIAGVKYRYSDFVDGDSLGIEFGEPARRIQE